MKPSHVMIKQELVRRGNFRWALRPIQEKIFDFLDSKSSRHLVVHVHRRGGKSHAAVLRAIQTSVRSTSNTKYLCPSEKMVRKIARPLVNKILPYLPAQYPIRWVAEDSSYRFPHNGSVLVLGASDRGFADSHRGTDTHLAILDEVGFMADPDALVSDVLMPSVIPVDGQIIHVSTSPRSPSHPFAVRARQAERDGNYIRLPASDNPQVTPSMLSEFQAESGGENSSTYRREYNCEFVKDESTAVLSTSPGNFFGNMDKKPNTLGCYLDFNGVCFLVAIHRTEDGKLLCLDEHVTRHPGSIHEITKVFEGNLVRVAVGPKISEIADLLASRHGFPVVVPKHYSVISGVVALKTRLATKLDCEILLSPRCPVLRRHLEDATWYESDGGRERIRFDSSGDGGFFEGVQALASVCSVFSASQTSDVDGFLSLTGEDPHAYERDAFSRLLR